MGVPFAQGLQFVLDAHQKFVRQAAAPVYLRVPNFTDDQAGIAVDVGVSFAPTGTGDTGFTDIQIQPMPYVTGEGRKNIGLDGARVMVGKATFVISNTFVDDQLRLSEMVEAGITNGYDIFRNRDGHKVIGVYYLGALYAIEGIKKRTIAGKAIAWVVEGTSQYEENVTANGGP